MSALASALAAVQPSRFTVAGTNDPRVSKLAEGFADVGPKNWTINVLNDQQWQEWQRHVPHATNSAFSLAGGANRTYLSESYLKRHSDDEIEYKMAHELGHLMTGSAKEDDADRWARNYLKSRKR